VLALPLLFRHCGFVAIVRAFLDRHDALVVFFAYRKPVQFDE